MLFDVAMENDAWIHTRVACTIRDESRLRDLDVIHDPLFVVHYDSTPMHSDDRICDAFAATYR